MRMASKVERGFLPRAENDKRRGRNDERGAKEL